MIRWIIRGFSLAFVLFSLLHYPLIPAGKLISVVYHLKGTITENKILDDTTRKELLELTEEALAEVTEKTQ